MLANVKFIQRSLKILQWTIYLHRQAAAVEYFYRHYFVFIYIYELLSSVRFLCANTGTSVNTNELVKLPETKVVKSIFSNISDFRKRLTGN